MRFNIIKNIEKRLIESEYKDISSKEYIREHIKFFIDILARMILVTACIVVLSMIGVLEKSRILEIFIYIILYLYPLTLCPRIFKIKVRMIASILREKAYKKEQKRT